jgi:lipoprotein-anchoring transpeptidase ErfK/SrfK
VRTRVASVALLAAVVVGLGALVHHSAGSAKRATPVAQSLANEAGRLPPPERPAFKVGVPRLLSPHETRARFASVASPIEARAEPAPDARPVAPLDLRTPEGTTNIVLVVGEQTRPDGVWVRVRLPVLPNDLTGWVPRRALGGYHFVHTHLVVDRARFTATLFRDGRKVFAAAVGVGKPESPTPSGEFYVRDRLSGFGDPFYGPVAFGTSARSAILTDWPAGGFVGIHGTNEPGLIPGRISHGCIRMRNADIVRLSRLMPVGTPLTIR